MNPSNSNIYVKSNGNDILLSIIYLVDIINTFSEANAIKQIRSNMSKFFDIIDIGLLWYYLSDRCLENM